MPRGRSVKPVLRAVLIVGIGVCTPPSYGQRSSAPTHAVQPRLPVVIQPESDRSPPTISSAFPKATPPAAGDLIRVQGTSEQTAGTQPGKAGPQVKDPMNPTFGPGDPAERILYPKSAFVL